MKITDLAADKAPRIYTGMTDRGTPVTITLSNLHACDFIDVEHKPWAAPSMYTYEKEYQENPCRTSARISETEDGGLVIKCTSDDYAEFEYLAIEFLDDDFGDSIRATVRNVSAFYRNASVKQQAGETGTFCLQRVKS